MSFKYRPCRRVEGYLVSCLGCFQCVILSAIKKRMNQLLLPCDYSTIQELIIVFTACVFLTGNVLAFVENCSHCISLGCEQTHMCEFGENFGMGGQNFSLFLFSVLFFFFFFSFFSFFCEGPGGGGEVGVDIIS